MYQSDLNVRAVLALAHHVGRRLRERQRVGMIFLASTVAFAGVPGMSAYAASKAHVLTFAEGFAGEVAADGIAVLALCPGPTSTEIWPSGAAPTLPMSPEAVADAALLSLGSRTTVVAGLLNRLITLSTRFAPRRVNSMIFGMVVGGMLKDAATGSGGIARPDRFAPHPGPQGVTERWGTTTARDVGETPCGTWPWCRSRRRPGRDSDPYRDRSPKTQPRRWSMNAMSTIDTTRTHPLENRVPPPLVVALIGAAMAVATRLTPPVEIDGGLRLAVGGNVIAQSALLVVQGARTFWRNETTIDPVGLERASTLVTGGVFRLSRNPMYVGFAAALVGWAVCLASPWALLSPVAFVVFTTRFQIIPEERVMRAKVCRPVRIRSAGRPSH